MIPTYEDFMMPTLQILSDGKECKSKEIQQKLQDLCNLTDEYMDDFISSGVSRARA